MSNNNKLENVIRYMLKARKLTLNSSEKNDSMVLAQMNGLEERSQKYSSICNLMWQRDISGDINAEINF